MKKLFVLVFAIALCLGVLCVGASADYSGKPEKPDGTGTVDDPYKISSAENLYWFAGLVNGDTSIIGSEVQQNKSANAVLTDNITINSDVLGAVASSSTPTYTWTPIGNNSNRYTGTFDGQGYTISGLYYSGDDYIYAGLFGYVGSGGRVQNVNVVDSYISVNVGDSFNVYVGGVCGYSSGTIMNCSFDGSVNGNGNGIFTCVGGVSGYNSGTIMNCYNTGTVTGTGNVGGACGYNRGTITNCNFAGSVTGTGTINYVGGVCGQNHRGTITNCYNTGTVKGSYYTGGVCAANSGTITNCYNTGTVTGNDNVGGVCGHNYGATIMNCYNTGSVNGSGNYTGDVCGKNEGTITNCYWQRDTADEADASAKTKAQFASGEVAWLLNGGTQMNGPWRQNLSGETDAYPTLDQSHHKVTQKDGGYANDDEHYYDNDGFCSCGGYEPATPDANGVYQISNAGQLYWFAGLVNGDTSIIGSEVQQNKSANAVLTADIIINTGVLSAVASGSTAELQPWTPMGNNKNYAYTGTFDGGNHTISGLYYDDSGEYVGLFGYVYIGGRVQNVNVADSYISNNAGDSDTGGVCGCNNGGTITNCSFSGSVTCNNTYTYVGGVCGWNAGTTENCYNAGSVTSVGSYTRVGGVCGYNYSGSAIRNCYNTGAVNGENTDNGYFYAGGVCGNNDSLGLQSTITNCYNTGSVTVSVTGSGNGNIYAGGVCGQNIDGTITNCCNTGAVTGSNNGSGSLCVGGVCGYNYDSTITNCYNRGAVTGSGNVGGVCGKNSDGTITNCYWLDVEGSTVSGIGNDSGTGEAISKTAEEFASGEVAWLLNSDQENGPWRQNLSDERDDYPVLDSTHKEAVKLTVDSTVSYLNKGDSFSGETNKAYFKADVAIELPYTVNEDTELTSAAIYTVTVVYDNGTADTKEQVVDGESFTLPDAPSKSGYYFVGWSDGNTTYKAGAMVENITADTTFTAVWREINIPTPNSITVTQPENGSIKVNPSNGSAGTLITVTATPDEGYELAYITVDGEKITGNTFRMPDKAVTVSAVFVPATFPFVDVKTGDWFYDYVAYVYSNGLMDGTSATTFEPNANMTRAMVWAILARIDGETVTGTNWLETARTWAMANGVSDGENANGYVTREQLATMLWRYAGEPDSDYSLSAFTDAGSVSDYAETAMAWAVEHSIITGMTDTTIVPQGTATRAQCAAMLMRFVEL